MQCVEVRIRYRNSVRQKKNKVIIIQKIEKMRRKSVKKSSMFKVQQDKNIYKKYLGQIDNCATVRTHPHLLESIERTSKKIYNYCYDFAEENPFNRGINYGCKDYGLSFPTSNLMVIREWVPNAKEVYLVGDFNQWNESSHPMLAVQDEKNMFMLELDISQQRITNQSRIFLRIVDGEGRVFKMPPPSCKIRNNAYGYICIDVEMPAVKQPKKQDIIMAYTIDITKIPLHEVTSFIEAHEEILQNFNTIILRSLFDSEAVMDRGTLTLEQMKCLRDIVNKVKNQMGLKIIIQWCLEPGTLKYSPDNPIEKQLLKKDQGNLYHYDITKQQVIALYLASLSYYLSTFQIDGYHFKRIDSFCKDEEGQILVKCLNIMNSRLHENGFTLASCKKQVPGLNQPILEGGLGFTFTYNYSENFLQCKDHNQLKQKFNRLLESSNCVAINLDQLTSEHELNFLFAVLVSGKGIFCKGQLSPDNYPLLNKLLTIRKQPQLFNDPTTITSVHASTITIQRGNTVILFNFGEGDVQERVENVKEMEVINSFGRREPGILEDGVKLAGRSCCIFQK